MIKSLKWTVLSSVLVVAVSAIAMQVVMVRELKYKQGGYTTNSGELVGGSLVGQTFVATKEKLSGVSVMMATYSGRNNTKPVEFHLRHSIDDRVDLRKVTVDPEEFGDNQFYTFSFKPVVGSKGKTYFFFLTSPESVKGDAVTVDIDVRDPYYYGSAYMVRGQDEDVIDAQVLARSGKPEVDVAFANYYTVRLREAMTNKIVFLGRSFINTWGESKAIYWLWLKVAIPSILLIVFILLAAGVKDLQTQKADRSKNLIGWMLLTLFVLAISFRVMYAVEMPVTNDEGNYLYDARTLISGKLAGGDGYVKTPLVVLWVAVWQALLGGSLFVGRLSSVVIGSMVIWPIYILGREIGGRRAGVAAAALWALLGVTAVFNTYVHTQSLAVFFGVSGLAVLFMALRGTVPRMTYEFIKRVPATENWFWLAGVLLGLGVVSRKSILALGLVPIVLILIEGKSWGRRAGHFLQVGLGFLLVVAIFLTLASLVYGVEGFWEAVGVNSAEDGIMAVEESQREQVRAYSLRGMTPFFRESLPLIMLAAIGLGVAIERLVGAVLGVVAGKIKFVSMAGVNYVLSKLGWVLPVAAFWWAWGFFSEYEGSSVMVFGMDLLWYAMFGLLVLIALLPKVRGGRSHGQKVPISIFEAKKRELSLNVEAKEQNGNEVMRSISWYSSGVLLSIVWLSGLVFFYMNWIKFHANYIGEFLPPLVILAGIGAPAAWFRCRNLSKLLKTEWLSAIPIRFLLTVFMLAVWMWAMFVSGYVTYVFEHTGTFQIDAAYEAAQWAKENISPDQSIFTGAALIPYLSGHDTALDIAHPRWYAYEFTRNDTVRINTFLPSVDEMLQAFRDTEWLLLDKQTRFSFLMEYSEIERGLENDFVAVKGISNGSNTLTFYRRVK